MKTLPFKAFENNITSQHGEDGVIQELCRRLGISRGLCVEFGAWDGEHLSNTWSLWKNYGWSAVLIEGDHAKHSALKSATAGNGQVTTLCAYVGTEGDSSLDRLLAPLIRDRCPDLISIDVDGDDYLIFESIEVVKPKIVVVEYNPTIPPHLDIVQQKGEYFGASALALTKLASRKGYCLAHLTGTNLLFVERGHFVKLDIKELILDEVFDYTRLACVITSYDGRSLLSTPLTYRPELRDLASFVRVLCGKRNLLRMLICFGKPPEQSIPKVKLSSSEGLLAVELFK